MDTAAGNAKLSERMVKRHMVVAKRMLQRWLRLRQAMLLLSRSFKASTARLVIYNYI